jgi:hypothetical protein
VSNEQTSLEKRDKPMAAMVEVEQARVVQEVQGAIVMARKFPRDEQAAMAKILRACERPALAEAAIYAYPKGTTTVTGPSIRLAEAIAQAWGNLQFGVRELSRSGAESTAQAVAWDLESNTRAEKIFQVPHTLHTKTGDRRLTDPRDIYEMVANQGARRLRACILSLIPGDVVDAAVSQCEKTEDSKSAPLEQRITKMVEEFGKIGVTTQDLENKLKHPIKSTSAAEVKSLGRVLLTIQDGMASKEDYFAPKVQPGQAQSVRGAVAAKADQSRSRGPLGGIFRGGAKPEPETQPEAEGDDDPARETGGEGPDLF